MKRFIVGTGRCGSTLLSRMLAVSPEMVSIFEFFNGLQSPKRFAREKVSARELWSIIAQPHAFVTMVTSRGHRVEEVVYPFDRPGSRYGPGDDLPWLLVATLPRLSDEPDALFDETRDFVRTLPDQSMAQHYVQLFEWWTARCGGRVWNERSGSGIDYTGDLAELYPDARFLHLHRSGEEASLSMREHAAFRLAISIVYDLDPEVDLATALARLRPESGVDDPVARLLERRPDPSHFGRFWSDQIGNGLRALKDLRPEQYMEVRFEDLIVSPIETLECIAGFFEMDPLLDGWIEQASSLVDREPSSRMLRLGGAEREDLRAACRTANLLIGRSASEL